MSQTPKKWKVEGALILTQVLFGLGAIFGKLGVETFNPVRPTFLSLERTSSNEHIVFRYFSLRFAKHAPVQFLQYAHLC